MKIRVDSGWIPRRWTLESFVVWLNESSSVLSREWKESCFYRHANSNPPTDQMEQCKKKLSSCGNRSTEAGGTNFYQGCPTFRFPHSFFGHWGKQWRLARRRPLWPSRLSRRALWSSSVRAESGVRLWPPCSLHILQWATRKPTRIQQRRPIWARLLLPCARVSVRWRDRGTDPRAN